MHYNTRVFSEMSQIIMSSNGYYSDSQITYNLVREADINKMITQTNDNGECLRYLKRKIPRALRSHI